MYFPKNAQKVTWWSPFSKRLYIGAWLPLSVPVWWPRVRLWTLTSLWLFDGLFWNFTCLCFWRCWFWFYHLKISNINGFDVTSGLWLTSHKIAVLYWYDGFLWNLVGHCFALTWVWWDILFLFCTSGFRGAGAWPRTNRCVAFIVSASMMAKS